MSILKATIASKGHMTGSENVSTIIVPMEQNISLLNNDRDRYRECWNGKMLYKGYTAVTAKKESIGLQDVSCRILDLS